MTKQRDYSLDLVRILACFMVVLMHSPMQTENANGLLLSSLSYFTAPCIGLFFMVSGALLLLPPIYTRYTNASAENLTLIFLKKRLKKVLLPTLVWTSFYIAVKVCDGELKGHELLRSVISIPFSAQGHGVLWFMYTLIGLYLVTPIISAWIRNAAEFEIRFYLLLWLVAMCYPLLQPFVDVNNSQTGILYYFSGYVGYFVLGYWMQYYGEKISLKVATLLMSVSVMAPVIVKLAHWTVDFYEVFWYLSIFVAVQCVFWWKVMKSLAYRLRLSDRAKNFVTMFSNLSFGIYLSHIFIMRHWIWHMSFLERIQSQPIQIAVIVFVTLVLAFSLSWMLCMTPLGNVVVGWRCRKVKS